MYVRDLLSFEVDARGDGTHTPAAEHNTEGGHDACFRQDDSCNVRAALQILQTSVRAPQNTQTAAEVHSLVAVNTDEHEIARINMQCAAGQAGLLRNSRPPPAKVGETNGQESSAGGRARTQWLAQCWHGW